MASFWDVLVSADMPFLRYALGAILIASVPFGMIGSLVVVRRMGALAGAVSHSLIGGVGVAFYLQVVWRVSWATPLLGAFFFAVVTGLFIGLLFVWGKERLDTILGAVWVIGMSLGILFLALTPTYVDPMSYLFGNILMLSSSDLWLLALIGLCVVMVTVVLYPQFQAVSFDEDFAFTRGVSVKGFQVVIILLVSVTVFLMLQVMGTVMVIALLTLPAAMASLFHRKLSSMMITSSVLVVVFSCVGMLVSYYTNLPMGSVIVLCAGVVYGLLVAGKAFFSRL